jgi:integrase
MTRNPARYLDPPRLARKEIKVLWPEDARRLLETVKTERWDALYGVALALGLRRGEALGLKWSDVNLEEQRLLTWRPSTELLAPGSGRPRWCGTLA